MNVGCVIKERILSLPGRIDQDSCKFPFGGSGSEEFDFSAVPSVHPWAGFAVVLVLS